jgi:hypothetical protein
VAIPPASIFKTRPSFLGPVTYFHNKAAPCNWDLDDRDGPRPYFKLSDRGLPFLQSGGIAGPNKKAYLKSRKYDPAIALSVFNHVICPVTLTVLHSSVSIQFSASVSHAHVRMSPHQHTCQIRGKSVASHGSVFVGRSNERISFSGGD